MSGGKGLFCAFPAPHPAPGQTAEPAPPALPPRPRAPSQLFAFVTVRQDSSVRPLRAVCDATRVARAVPRHYVMYDVVGEIGAAMSFLAVAIGGPFPDIATLSPEARNTSSGATAAMCMPSRRRRLCVIQPSGGRRALAWRGSRRWLWDLPWRFRCIGCRDLSW